MPATNELTDVLDKVRPRLRAMLVRERVPVEDAEDLVQEVILLLLGRWDAVRCKESWVLGALRFRIVLHFQRRNRRRKLGCMAAWELRAKGAGTLAQARCDARHDLSALAALLPVRQRQVLRFRYVAGLSTQEVGDRLGLDAATVRHDDWKARRGLRELFGRRGHLRGRSGARRSTCTRGVSAEVPRDAAQATGGGAGGGNHGARAVGAQQRSDSTRGADLANAEKSAPAGPLQSAQGEAWTLRTAGGDL
jgi:RNA polymerase sigma factor (sigma-70 family)